MKTLALLICALNSALSCEKSQLSEHGQAHACVISAFQAAEKAPAKQPAPTNPNSPAKKPSPKERERPSPPPHLFM